MRDGCDQADEEETDHTAIAIRERKEVLDILPLDLRLFFLLSKRQVDLVTSLSTVVREEISANGLD